MKQNSKGQEPISKRILRWKAILTLTAMLFLVNASGMVSCANYGQNASKWVTDQIFWVGVTALVIVLVMLAAKRNFTAALTTGLAGAVVLYFVKNPTKLADIGDTIMKTILP